MKKPHTALVSATPFNREIFERLPGLLDDLGPVKANSLRLASRAVNVFRSGFAAREWEELRHCRLVLVSASPEKLKAVLAEILDKLEPWNRRYVVLVNCGQDSRALDAFAARGAQVGSIHVLNDAADPVVVVEGDSATVRLLQKRLGPLKPLVLRKGASQLVELSCTQVRLTLPPLLETALLALQLAGLTAVQSNRLLDSIVTQLLRSFRKSGRRAWKEPRSAEERRAIRAQIEAFRLMEPEAADYLRRVIEASLSRLGRDTDWLGSQTGWPI